MTPSRVDGGQFYRHVAGPKVKIAWKFDTFSPALSCWLITTILTGLMQTLAAQGLRITFESGYLEWLYLFSRNRGAQTPAGNRKVRTKN